MSKRLLNSIKMEEKHIIKKLIYYYKEAQIAKEFIIKRDNDFNKKVVVNKYKQLLATERMIINFEDKLTQLRILASETELEVVDEYYHMLGKTTKSLDTILSINYSEQDKQNIKSEAEYVLMLEKELN